MPKFQPKNEFEKRIQKMNSALCTNKRRSYSYLYMKEAQTCQNMLCG